MKTLLVIFNNFILTLTFVHISWATSPFLGAHFAQNKNKDAQVPQETDPCKLKKNKLQRRIDSSFIQIIQLRMGCPGLAEEEFNNSEKKKLAWLRNWEKIGSSEFDVTDFLESADKYIAEYKTSIADLIEAAPFFTGEYPSIENLLLKTIQQSFSQDLKRVELRNWVIGYAFCAPQDEAEGFISESAKYFKRDTALFLSSLSAYQKNPSERVNCKRSKKLMESKSFAVNYLHLLIQDSGDELANNSFRSKVSKLLKGSPSSYVDIQKALEETLLNVDNKQDEAP